MSRGFEHFETEDARDEYVDREILLLDFQIEDDVPESILRNQRPTPSLTELAALQERDARIGDVAFRNHVQLDDTL